MMGCELPIGREKEGASEELEALLFIFSLAIKDDREALSHIDRLRALNQ